jgi:hypothetical protein
MVIGQDHAVAGDDKTGAGTPLLKPAGLQPWILELLAEKVLKEGIIKQVLGCLAPAAKPRGRLFNTDIDNSRSCFLDHGTEGLGRAVKQGNVFILGSSRLGEEQGAAEKKNSRKMQPVDMVFLSHEKNSINL